MAHRYHNVGTNSIGYNRLIYHNDAECVPRNVVNKLEQKCETMEEEVGKLRKELSELKEMMKSMLYHPDSPFIKDLGKVWQNHSSIN